MIKSITLFNYRNIINKTLTFNKNLTIFVGNNGVGKTSILEAMYLCGTSKSHKTNNFHDLINFDSDYASILLKDTNCNLKIILKDNKNYFLNNNKVSNINFINNIHTVIFSNLDLDYITGSNSKKIKYVDMLISLINTKYLKYLIEYKKIIKERNSLLKQAKIDYIYLKLLNDKLINYIYIINKYRNRFFNILNNKLINISKELNIENIKVIFNTDIDLNIISEKVSNNLNNDIKYKRTIYGPHSDHIEFMIDDKEVYKYASLGQTRSVAIALKLALVEIMIDNNIKPILLLDDVFAELDKYRQMSLIKYLKLTQTFITTTSITDIPQELLIESDIVYLGKDE